MGRSQKAHIAHPFEYWWCFGNGIRRILELGYGLYLLNEPVELTKDIASESEPDRFHTRSAEAWAGALLQSLGGTVCFVNESLHGKKPEAEVSWADKTIALEVKSPDISGFGSAMMVVETRLFLGLSLELEASPVKVSPYFDFPVAEIEAITKQLQRANEVRTRAARELQRGIKEGDATIQEDASAAVRTAQADWQQALSDATAIGARLGRELSELLDSSLVPGAEVVGENVYAVVVDEPSNTSFPSASFREAVQWSQITNFLGSSRKKFDSWGMPGILVLDHPMGRWSDEIYRHIIRVANRKNAPEWTASLGAIMLRYSSPLENAYGVMVVPVKARWGDLPNEIRAATRTSPNGTLFIPFDILQYQSQC